MADKRPNLLETICAKVGGEYLSDLHMRSNSRRARRLIARMNLSEYTINEINDAAKYLGFDRTEFATAEEAQDYFNRETSGAAFEKLRQS